MLHLFNCFVSVDLLVPEIRSHMCRCCWKPRSDKKPSPQQENQPATPVSLYRVHKELKSVIQTAKIYKRWSSERLQNRRHQNDRCQIQEKKKKSFQYGACCLFWIAHKRWKCNKFRPKSKPNHNGLELAIQQLYTVCKSNRALCARQ